MSVSKEVGQETAINIRKQEVINRKITANGVYCPVK